MKGLLLSSYDNNKVKRKLPSLSEMTIVALAVALSSCARTRNISCWLFTNTAGGMEDDNASDTEFPDITGLNHWELSVNENF